MAGFSKLLRRLGYAKLDSYGLVATADDRILATRPAVLDDGYGGRVVGWQADDLAAAELAPWSPRRAPTARMSEPVKVGSMPRIAVAETLLAPSIAVAPVAPVASPAGGAMSAARTRTAPATTPPPIPRLAKPPVLPGMPLAKAAMKPAPIVPEIEPDDVDDEDGEPKSDDDWEWTIAVARARAAAEEAELAAARVIPIASARKPVIRSAQPRPMTSAPSVVSIATATPRSTSVPSISVVAPARVAASRAVAPVGPSPRAVAPRAPRAPISAFATPITRAPVAAKPIVRPAPIAVARRTAEEHDPVTDVQEMLETPSPIASIGEDTQVELRVRAAPRRLATGTRPAFAGDDAAPLPPAPMIARPSQAVARPAQPSPLPSIRQRQASRA